MSGPKRAKSETTAVLVPSIGDLSVLLKAVERLESDLMREDAAASPSVTIRLFADGTGELHEETSDETLFEFSGTPEAITFCKAGMVQRLAMAQRKY